MSLIQINWNPGKEELRKFGLVMLAGSAAAACLLYWSGKHTLAAAVTAAGVAVLFVSRTSPMLARAVYKVWMGIAFVTGNIMSSIMLTAVYFLVVTPTGLVMRLAGHDRLRLRGKESGTYWLDLPRRTAGDSHERQF